jgi:hypothetical protein
MAPHYLDELWEDPARGGPRDDFYGPWGRQHAPDPGDTYKFVKTKLHGNSPGLTVMDAHGRKWHVKQGPEAPVEVAVSRILSDLGYHQPPVYFLDRFTLTDEAGTRQVTGGRFRLDDGSLRDLGDWSWQENPFVGTQPYQSLLVILMMFNSTDLKNSNNTLYELSGSREGATRWYVVRDLGASLGKTGRFYPPRNDAVGFEQTLFVRTVQDGYVKFDYHGRHKELLNDRVTVDDLRRASRAVARLTPQQWREAFRAGGYEPGLAERFIGLLHERVRKGEQIADAAVPAPVAIARRPE